jgi:hypothetical protein
MAVFLRDFRIGQNYFAGAVRNSLPGRLMMHCTNRFVEPRAAMGQLPTNHAFASALSLSENLWRRISSSDWAEAGHTRAVVVVAISARQTQRRANNNCPGQYQSRTLYMRGSTRQHMQRCVDGTCTKTERSASQPPRATKWGSTRARHFISRPRAPILLCSRTRSLAPVLALEYVL